MSQRTNGKLVCEDCDPTSVLVSALYRTTQAAPESLLRRLQGSDYEQACRRFAIRLVSDLARCGVQDGQSRTAHPAIEEVMAAGLIRTGPAKLSRLPEARWQTSHDLHALDCQLVSELLGVLKARDMRLSRH